MGGTVVEVWFRRFVGMVIGAKEAARTNCEGFFLQEAGVV